MSFQLVRIAPLRPVDGRIKDACGNFIAWDLTDDDVVMFVDCSGDQNFAHPCHYLVARYGEDPVLLPAEMLPDAEHFDSGDSQ